MAKKRKQLIRKKGKISLSEYFKELKEGEFVSIIKNKKIPSSFPERIVGRIGKIVGKKGKFYNVEVREGSRYKTFLIHPINLVRQK